MKSRNPRIALMETKPDLVFSFSSLSLSLTTGNGKDYAPKRSFQQTLQTRKSNANTSKPATESEHFLANYIITPLFKGQHRFDEMQDELSNYDGIWDKEIV